MGTEELTCRGQNQRLQDVRQRHNANDTRLLINDDQPVDLQTNIYIWVIMCCNMIAESF